MRRFLHDNRAFIAFRSGFVPRHLLIGRATRILVSADILGDWLPRPERFGQTLR